MAKVTRRGVFLSIYERPTEWQLLLGNRILSRHATRSDAVEAYDRETEARKGRHSEASSPAVAP